MISELNKLHHKAKAMFIAQDNPPPPDMTALISYKYCYQISKLITNNEVRNNFYAQWKSDFTDRKKNF